MKIAIPVGVLLLVAVALLLVLGADPAGSERPKTAAPSHPGRPPPEQFAPPPEEGHEKPLPSEPARDEPVAPAENPKKAELDIDRLLERTTVSLSLSDTSLLEALIMVAAEAGVGIEVPEYLQEEMRGRKITLSLVDIEAKAALDLILATSGMEATHGAKDGRLHIFRR